MLYQLDQIMASLTDPRSTATPLLLRTIQSAYRSKCASHHNLIDLPISDMFASRHTSLAHSTAHFLKRLAVLHYVSTMLPARRPRFTSLTTDTCPLTLSTLEYESHSQCSCQRRPSHIILSNRASLSSIASRADSEQDFYVSLLLVLHTHRHL